MCAHSSLYLFSRMNPRRYSVQKRSQLVPVTVGTCSYMCISCSLGANLPPNHSGVLHLCQPISVPVFANQSETFLEWFYFRQAGGFCCQGSQRANTDAWQKKCRQGSGANTNSGQKKYSRTDSNMDRTNLYFSDQTTFWKMGQLPS